jgi:hypothetical protein
MSTRNFDSRVVIERLQQKNHAKHVYDARARGQSLLHNPQTANGDASMMVDYQAGMMTTYQKGLLGGSITSNSGGPTGIPLYIESIVPPTAPTLLSITAGIQQLTVFFMGSVSDGGSPITTYEYSLDGVTYQTTGTLTSPFTISGLTNGVTYTIRMRANNAVGFSATSNSLQGTPLSTPSAPTGLSILAGNQQLTVSFTAGSDGGSPLTNYEYSVNNGLSYVAVSPAQTTSPIVITGLTNDTTYSVKLRAVNAVGVGAASATVTGTPVGLPSAPTLTYALSDDGQAYVYVIAGTGSPTNYEYTTDNGTTWTALSPADADSPVLVPGLANGVLATIQLRGVNGAGIGPASNAVTVTPQVASPSPAVLYYDPDNASSYSGGSTVTNIGSYVPALNGTKSAGVGYNQPGTATTRKTFQFNGTDSISFGSYSFGTTFAISAWVYPRSRSSINGLLANTSSGLSPSGFKIGWNNWNTSNLTMLFEGGNGSSGGAQSTVNNAVVLTTWQHLTYILDTTNQLIFFLRNGVPVTTASYSTNQIVANLGTNNPSFFIGTFTDSFYGMNAELGYLKVFSGIPSVADVNADFQATKASFGL